MPCVNLSQRSTENRQKRSSAFQRGQVVGVASSSRVQIDIVTRGIDQTKKSSDGATKNIGRVEKATRRSTKAMKKGKAELTGFRAKLKGLGDEAFALKNLFSGDSRGEISAPALRAE